MYVYSDKLFNKKNSMLQSSLCSFIGLTLQFGPFILNTTKKYCFDSKLSTFYQKTFFWRVTSYIKDELVYAQRILNYYQESSQKKEHVLSCIITDVHVWSKLMFWWSPSNTDSLQITSADFSCAKPLSTLCSLVWGF